MDLQEQENDVTSKMDWELDSLDAKDLVTLINEMEMLIDRMPEERFDTERVEAYLHVLQEKAPMLEELTGWLK